MGQLEEPLWSVAVGALWLLLWLCWCYCHAVVVVVLLLLSYCCCCVVVVAVVVVMVVVVVVVIAVVVFPSFADVVCFLTLCNFWHFSLLIQGVAIGRAP